jgi:hypothetical protein
MKAFPNMTGEKGMDLRDYFAAKAMQSLITISTKAIADELITSKNVVDASYQWADAMMKAREHDTDK